MSHIAYQFNNNVYFVVHLMRPQFYYYSPNNPFLKN